MAVTKILPRNGGLKEAIDYVLNGDKTDGHILTAHFNCDPGREYREMMKTKLETGRLDKRQCYHIIQSFKPGEITPELALEIAKAFAQEHLDGFEVVIGTHVDRHHIHSHIVFNSVNADTGEKYHSKETLDMDRVSHLSGYDRERVCVPQVCDCKQRDCRYQRFLNTCDKNQFLFQICNHNLLVADAIHRSEGKRPIFPEHSIIIVDEAHKLPETAQQMLGVTLAAEEIRNLILQLKEERYLLAAEMLEDSTGPLLRKLAQPREEAEPVEACLRLLTAPSRTLPIIQRQIGSLLSPLGSCQLNTVLDAVRLFTSSQTDMIFYTAEDATTGGTMLCAAADDITQRMKKILWQPDQAFVLTSGTMAVGSDFRRFKTQAGLEKGHRVMESVSPSPFDYRNNCLLYLPQIPPRQRVEDTDVYFNELTAELVGLIKAASGHALVLFTSYAAMSAVKERLREESLPFPLLTLGRNAPHIIEQFRHTPGAVLLATGAAWEGFDFPGDCVSLLIIPRLPFAYPDARKERELEKYSSLHAFIREVAVPEMQIKLRQGFGRAIRTESDTCVIAILDERACRGRRYAQAVSEALPEMRRTGSLREVTRFLREKKPESYFEVER